MIAIVAKQDFPCQIKEGILFSDAAELLQRQVQKFFLGASVGEAKGFFHQRVIKLDVCSHKQSQMCMDVCSLHNDYLCEVTG